MRFLRWLRGNWRETLAVVADAWTVVGISVIGVLLPSFFRVFGKKVVLSDLFGATIFYMLIFGVFLLFSGVYIVNIFIQARGAVRTHASGAKSLDGNACAAALFFLFMTLVTAWFFLLGFPYLQSGWGRLTNNRYLLPPGPAQVFESINVNYDAENNLITGQVVPKKDESVDWDNYRALVYLEFQGAIGYIEADEYTFDVGAKIDTRGDFSYSLSPNFQAKKIKKYFIAVFLASDVQPIHNFPSSVSSIYATEFGKFDALKSIEENG